MYECMYVCMGIYMYVTVIDECNTGIDYKEEAGGGGRESHGP